MRNRIVTLLILLMAALPVWSASVPCCQLQRNVSAHHCCCDRMRMEKPHCHHASAADHAAQDHSCQCAQFQHSQFVLGLPQLPLLQPPARFSPETAIPTPLPERQETIIRPPIA